MMICRNKRNKKTPDACKFGAVGPRVKAAKAKWGTDESKCENGDDVETAQSGGGAGES
jgi:hypothetical protein